MAKSYNFDVLIIGSGAAGLTAALNLPSDIQIAVVTKAEALSGSTLYAQGGIAAVLDDKDSVDLHIADTLNAGRACVTKKWSGTPSITAERPSIGSLMKASLSLARQKTRRVPPDERGGHSHRRVIHSADATGKAVSTTLVDKARAANNIQIFENRVAVDLLTHKKLFLPGNRCVGAYVLTGKTSHVELFQGRVLSYWQRRGKQNLLVHKQS